VKLFKILSWIGAVLFLLPHFIFAQPQPSRPPVSGEGKLSVETIATLPLETRRNLLSALGSQEREKFFEQFISLPPGGPSNGKINALFMAWSQVEPRVALENAKKLPETDARRAAVEAICYGMESEDAHEIAKLIKNLPGDSLAPDQKERLLGISIVKWSQNDAAEAAHFLAEVYPDAATRLAKPGAGDGDLLIVTKGVAANWGAKAPEAALDWFQKKREPENIVAVQSVIAGWWRKDAKAAAAYIRAHTNTPNEREVAGLMAGAMAERDPRTATEWVEWIQDEKLRRRTKLAIAELWASRAPKEASAWAQKLPDQEGAGAISIVARLWTFSDAKSAEQWIDSLPREKRDAAIRGYATTMAKINPEAALSRVLKIQDGKARVLLTQAIASEWVRHSPEEARAWIKKSKLAQAQKKELLENASGGD
jgi:hypothetical protein